MIELAQLAVGTKARQPQIHVAQKRENSLGGSVCGSLLLRQRGELDVDLGAHDALCAHHQDAFSLGVIGCRWRSWLRGLCMGVGRRHWLGGLRRDATWTTRRDDGAGIVIVIGLRKALQLGQELLHLPFGATVYSW